MESVHLYDTTFCSAGCFYTEVFLVISYEHFCNT